MGFFKSYARQTTTVSRKSESESQFARMLRDGTLSMTNFIQAMILEGKGYQALEGAFSTPATGGGTTAVIDQDRPNFSLGVPDGKAILPFRIHVVAQMPLLATDSDESEILIAVDKGTKISVAAATAVTIYNLRSDQPYASTCDAEKTHSTNITTSPTLHMELGHAVKVGDVQTAVGTTWAGLELLYEPLAVPVLVGPCTLFVYHGGTVATTGFTVCQWIELAKNELT